MNKIWQDGAWEDYIYWQTQDRRTLKRVNLLLQDIDRNCYDGIGKPEALKGNLVGWWSRRILSERENAISRNFSNRPESLWRWW